MTQRILFILISLSVTVIMVESVDSIDAKYHTLLWRLELVFTILFTIEYLVRIAVARKPQRYMRSFFGIVDLLSILPTYLSLIFVGPQYFVVIRVLRLLRIFRVLKMARHVGDANVLMNALKASRTKITVFLFFVLALTSILGTLMFLVEGEIFKNPGFNNIPESIYWTVVTISTVGYGDVTPLTPYGKFVATIVILVGYGIIAVPTGIVTAELNRQAAKIRMDTRKCSSCGTRGHDPRALYCKMCGDNL